MWAPFSFEKGRQMRKRDFLAGLGVTAAGIGHALARDEPAAAVVARLLA